MIKNIFSGSVVPVLILLVFIWTLLPVESGAGTAIEFDSVKNEGYVAFIVNEYQPEKDTDEEEKEELCDGSGYITHGDGHKTPCPGCDNCETGQEPVEEVKKNLSLNQPSQLVEPENTIPLTPPSVEEQSLTVLKDGSTDKQVLFFTASWCGPCRSFKSREVPRLKGMGLKVDESKDADVRIVDIDKKDYQTLKAYKSSRVVPEFVLVENNRLVKYMTGYQSASTIARWLK